MFAVLDRVRPVSAGTSCLMKLRTMAAYAARFAFLVGVGAVALFILRLRALFEASGRLWNTTN